MTQIKRTELELYHEFDRTRCRHYLNGQLSVLHCHHYTNLYTRLAMDAEFVDGKSLLAESAEDSFYAVFKDYFAAQPGLKRANWFALGCQHYAAVGLGQMEVVYAGRDSGEVVLHHSHVDEGWIKKWGLSDEPVNYITCGYVAALFANVYDLPPRSYAVSETESVVKGATQSRLKVVRR